MIRTYVILLINFLFIVRVAAQNSENLATHQRDNKKTAYTSSTFGGSHVVLGQSVENIRSGELNFLIQHHFGTFNSGAYQFWGLDQSDIRLGFEYGITDWWQIGIGRSSYNKLFDGNLKLKLLRQQKGGNNIPLSISFFSDIVINSLKWAEPDRDNLFSSRISYSFQLLFARKFSKSLSLQLSPTLIHRNLVETIEDPNDVYSIGTSGRYKIGKRFSVNAEYFYLLPGKTANDFYNSFSLGFDIETSGHVFQVFLTNSNAMVEPAFIAETIGSWAKGDIRLGFNITRTFTLVHHDYFTD